MYAGFLDVFLDAGDDASRFVSQGVDIEFGGLLEKFIDQNRPLVREIHRRAHVIIETVLVVDDGHGATPEHITRAHQHGITDAVGCFASPFDRCCRSVLWLRDAKFVEQRAEPFSIFCQVD